MKNITTYINEAASSWMDDIIKELEKEQPKQDTVYDVTVFWRIYLSGSKSIKNYYGEILSEPNIPDGCIAEFLGISVITTDKGNFYGVNRSLTKNNPKIAKLFNKRVKGTTGTVWTNSIDNIREFIQIAYDQFNTSRWYSINKPYDGDFWKTYLYTSKEEAKSYAKQLEKITKLDVVTNWHEEKIKTIKAEISRYKESITYYENNIKDLNAKIKDLEDDLVEFENMKNVASDDFNESLE